MGHKAVSKWSQWLVISWHVSKTGANGWPKFWTCSKILYDKIPHKIVAKSSRVSRTHSKLVANPLQFSRNHFGTQHICKINKTELPTYYNINGTLFSTTLQVNKTKRRSGKHRETIARRSHNYCASVLNYTELCRQWFIKSVLLSEMIVPS